MAGPFDIFILGGQSNCMYAYAYNQSEIVAPARLYQIKQNQTIAPATQCMDFPGLPGDSQPLVSFAVTFLRDYYIPQKLATGRDVLIVPGAQGGSGFYGVFAKTGGQHTPAAEAGYTNIVTLTNAALAAGASPAGNVIKGLFWQHGEQDVGDSGSGLGDGSGVGYYTTMTRAAGYTRYFTEFVAGLKADVTGSKFSNATPIMIGSQPPDLVYHPTVAQLPNYPSGIGVAPDGVDHHNSNAIGIVQACSAMPSNVTNCAYVDPLNPYKLVPEQQINPTGVVQFWLHYCQADSRELARRYWQAYVKLVDTKTLVAVKTIYAPEPAKPVVTLSGGGFTSASLTFTINITTAAAATGDILNITLNETVPLLSHIVTAGENGLTAFSYPFTLPAGFPLIGVQHVRGSLKSKVGTIALKVGGPDLGLSNNSVPDSATTGTKIGILFPIGTTGVYTYSLLSNPGSLFSISGTGLLVATALTSGIYPITVRASGGTPTPIDTAFNIRVTPPGTVAISSNVWMETPDIIGFYVDDAPIIHGTTITTAARAEPYDIPFQMPPTNEWAHVIGTAKTTVHFVDRPPPTYINKVNLHTLANYSMSGGRTITAVYFRDHAIDSGTNYVSTVQTLLSQFRHFVYLKLSGPLVNGITYTISNSAGSTFSPISFTYNDKLMRAGGLKVSQFGVRADDTFKRAYLTSRVPSAPNNGVVDFAATYGITTAQIINASTGATVATVNVNLGVAWNAMETGDFYATGGIDVADTSVGYAVTGMTAAASPVITCPGHTFVNGDKVRFHGLSGMIQTVSPNSPYELLGVTNLWNAPTVSGVVAGTSFQTNLSSVGFSAFSTTPIFDATKGGINNTVHKCFNTNRAGTNVYDIDLSTFTTAGNYYIYIPGYGISDPFYVGTEAYANITGNLHQGVYNMRLGCDCNKSTGWTRPLATVDGVNGTAIYWSTLPAIFTTEGAQAIAPTGTTTVRAGMGGYSNEGTLTLTNLVWSGGTVTATTSVPHGIPNGNFPLSIINCLPAGYNFNTATSGGVTNWATITGASTFTYAVASNPGAFTQLGIARTGWLTSTRATGFRASTQDAGDNDDLACDHVYGWMPLAFVFNNIPAASRFTPFTVQKCTELLNATTYAGTDSLPPLFHEICWYADNFRVQQNVNGDIPGGFGYPSLGSQIPNYPEPIHLNRGYDPLGSRAGQTTMAFVYASDHFTTMAYAALAAQIALICQGYGSLTTLSNLWRDSAVLAYNRARTLIYDLAARDAYYVTQLNLPTKIGWSNAQYNEAMGTLTARAILQEYNAAGALYRLLGQPSGQVPYGNFIELSSLTGAATVGTGSGGSGYAVGDLIVLAGGTPITIGTTTARAIVRVTAVSGTTVTTTVMYANGEYTVAPITPFTQFSTTGSGTGASFQTATFVVTYSSMQSAASIGGYDYSVTPGNLTAAKNYFTTRNVGNSAANGPIYTSAALAFNTMIAPTLSVGGSYPNQPSESLLAHMYTVFLNPGNPTNYSSIHLQSMSAHMQWLAGANLPGKSMMARLGVRSVSSILHEDQFRMGVPAPPGIVPYAYTGWAAAGIFAFQGSGTNTDGSLTHIADNTNGTNEALAQPGSTKMWNNWRYGTSYWEHQPESHGTITIGEYDLRNMLGILYMALYIHGWDGNV